MRTEKMAGPCPGCGANGTVWRVTSSRGAVTLECTACPWTVREKQEGVT